MNEQLNDNITDAINKLNGMFVTQYGAEDSSDCVWDIDVCSTLIPRLDRMRLALKGYEVQAKFFDTDDILLAQTHKIQVPPSYTKHVDDFIATLFDMITHEAAEVINLMYKVDGDEE